MIAANVLSKEEFPDFDEETGILPKVDDEEGMCCLFMIILCYSLPHQTEVCEVVCSSLPFFR